MDDTVKTLKELYKDKSFDDLVNDLAALKEKESPQKSVEEEEFDSYLKLLFTEHIQANIKKGISVFEKVFGDNKNIPTMTYQEVMDKLKKALNVISIIEECENDEDIYKTFQPEKLKQILTDVENALTVVQAVAEATGFMAANDEGYMLIMPKLHASHLPPEDMDMLKEMNVDNPKEYMNGMLFKIKHTIQDASSQKGIMADADFLGSISTMSKSVLNRAKVVINEKIKIMNKKDSDIKKMPKKKWWGATGTIIKGIGLIAGNIALAMTAEPVAISGAIPSTATGIGTIVEGIGKIKDE